MRDLWDNFIGALQMSYRYYAMEDFHISILQYRNITSSQLELPNICTDISSVRLNFLQAQINQYYCFDFKATFSFKKRIVSFSTVIISFDKIGEPRTW